MQASRERAGRAAGLALLPVLVGLFGCAAYDDGYPETAYAYPPYDGGLNYAYFPPYAGSFGFYAGGGGFDHHWHHGHEWAHARGLEHGHGPGPGHDFAHGPGPAHGWH